MCVNVPEGRDEYDVTRFCIFKSERNEKTMLYHSLYKEAALSIEDLCQQNT